MVYLQYRNHKDNICFSRKMLEKYTIDAQRIILKIGAFSHELIVNLDDELPEDTIGIPKSLHELITIPDDIPYELVVNGRILSLGPVIAFVAYFNSKELNPKRLDRLKSRFANYLTIKGLIYVCAARGINIENKTIEGYYFNPKGTSANSRWIYGVFPYPDVVYKRHPVDLKRYNDLISYFGDRVINSYYFCKGELPGYSQENQELRRYFPHTEPLQGVEQLDQMLTVYQSVYLKPRNGAGGRGIFNVTKDEEGSYVFINHKKVTTIIKDERDLILFLKNLINHKYIIQQSVSTIIEGRNVDFRVYAQKNGLKQWVCQGMIGRVARKDMIITNLKGVEQLLPGEKAIKYLFGIDNLQVNQIQKKVYDACINVCKELDKTIGNYGDVAIDCIVDRDYNVWILEINKKYGYDSLVRIKERKLMRTLLTTPFQYAKALAGF